MAARDQGMIRILARGSERTAGECDIVNEGSARRRFKPPLRRAGLEEDIKMSGKNIQSACSVRLPIRRRSDDNMSFAENDQAHKGF